MTDPVVSPNEVKPPTVGDFAKAMKDNHDLSKFSLMLLNQLHPAKKGKAEKMLELVLGNHIDKPDCLFMEGDNKEIVAVQLKGTFGEPELRLIAQAMRERNDALKPVEEKTPIIEA
mgnify:CR=1 FL=1